MYRIKIEQTMDLTPKAIPISKLLSQILSHAVKFDKKRHFKLIKLCKKLYFKFNINWDQLEIDKPKLKLKLSLGS